MPSGFYKIVVVCEHRGRAHQGKKRVIDRLSWLDTDPEDEAAFRSSMAERDAENEEVLQIILLNDRFSRSDARTNRAGRAVEQPSSTLTYWAGEEVVDRAQALGAFRFQCRCGADRPLRQSTLDAWIRQRIADDISRRAFEFEISG